MNKKTLCKICASVLALLLWQVLAMIVRNEILLVSPVKVIARLFVLLFEKSFWGTVFMTSGRILLGFLSALFSGIVLAFLSRRFFWIEMLLWPYIVAIRAVPIASFAILCLIFMSFGKLTVFISFLIAFPVIYANVLQGLKKTDPKLLEVARVFHMPFSRRFLYIDLMAAEPYLLSAAEIAIGMAFKAGIAAEVIGVVKDSIGEKLYEAKIYLETCDLLAWTVVIILLSIFLEKLFRFLFNGIFSGVKKL